MKKTMTRALVAFGLSFGVYLGYKAYKQHKLVKESEISAEEVQAELETRRLLALKEVREESHREFLEDDVEFIDEEQEYLDSELDIYDVNIETAIEGFPKVKDVIERLSDKPLTMGDYDETYDRADALGLLQHWNWEKKQQEMIDKRERLAQKPEEEKVEEEILKHDPNSDSALTQYFNMQLAGFDSPEIIKIMTKLFGMQFAPVNAKDLALYEKIQEQRSEFFGPDSRWNSYASIGELILMFAEMADYEIDGGVESYVDDWLDNVGISLRTGDASLDRIVDGLVNHVHMGRRGFGLFGLDQDAYDNQLLKYPDAKIKSDKDISFLMEYEVWLTGMLELLSDDYEEEE